MKKRHLKDQFEYDLGGTDDLFVEDPPFDFGWLKIGLICGLIVLAVLALVSPANAFEKNCSLDGTANLSPPVPQTLINSFEFQQGDVVTFMGESNMNGITEYVNVPPGTTKNDATAGGCTIGAVARGQDKCWNKVAANPDVFVLKPINRSRGQDLSVYESSTITDTRNAILRIAAYNPRAVLLLDHHATPYSQPNNRGVEPKQGEPYSHWAYYTNREVALNPPNVNFQVIHWASLWANANRDRADGLRWTCEDTGNDGVHLSDTGYRKAGALVTEALGGAVSPNPDPDPDPEPQQCPIEEAPAWCIRKGGDWSWRESRQACTCQLSPSF